MRTMFDSVDPTRLPADAEMVAGYVDGAWPTYTGLLGRYPVVVSIATSSSHPADVLDVESGDATTAAAPYWVTAMRAAGRARPTVYCNASTWPAVRAAFTAVGVAEPDYWVAHYDNDPAVPPGAVAKQYRSDTAANLDYSSVADDTWHPSPAPDDQEAILVGLLI